jgi:monoamine oxidase
MRVARELGRRVHLARPVRRIVQSRHGVRVESDGLTFAGRRAIVALAPVLAGRIRFEPDLPELPDQLTQRAPMYWNDYMDGAVRSGEPGRPRGGGRAVGCLLCHPSSPRTAVRSATSCSTALKSATR